MLTIVQSRPPARDKRLHVAISHLEAAIVHINNEAQGCMPVKAGADRRQVDDLRLMVRAQSDIIYVLRSAGHLEAAGEHDGAEDYHRRSAQAAPNFVIHQRH